MKLTLKDRHDIVMFSGLLPSTLDLRQKIDAFWGMLNLTPDEVKEYGFEVDSLGECSQKKPDEPKEFEMDKFIVNQLLQFKQQLGDGPTKDSDNVKKIIKALSVLEQNASDKAK